MEEWKLKIYFKISELKYLIYNKNVIYFLLIIFISFVYLGYY